MEPLPRASIRDHVAHRTDPRGDHTGHHPLLDGVTIALRGVIRGAESWAETEQFGNAQLSWLRPFPALPPGIPPVTPPAGSSPPSTPSGSRPAP